MKQYFIDVGSRFPMRWRNIFRRGATFHRRARHFRGGGNFIGGGATFLGGGISQEGARHF